MDYRVCDKLFLICLLGLFFSLSVKAQYSLVPSDQFATRNREFMLTCTFGSSSVAFYFTWTRDGSAVASVQTSDCQTARAPGSTLYSNYNYSCTLSTRSYNLIIPATRINDEGGSAWKCEASGGGGVGSNTYTLQFYTTPNAGPVLSGYDGLKRFPGNIVTLTCTVSGGVPLATITWTCKGTTVQGTSSDTETSALSTCRVNIDQSFDGHRCRCTASHPTWTEDKVEQSQVFVVHYPPSSNPVVKGYDGSPRYKDDTVTLTCQVSGGSPLATLSWTCNGRPVASNTGRSNSTTVISDVTVTMTKELHRKTCICQGRHSDPSYVKDVPSTEFVVYYPPSVPLVQASSTTRFPWIESGSGTLQCSITEGNPPMTYEWLNAAGVMSGQTTNTLTLTSLTKDDNRKSYRCKVSNDYTVQKNQNLISQPRVLDVEYRPVINIGMTPSYIRETETFERTCIADGNPTPTVTWTPNTNPSNIATLRLVNIMRNQTGGYTCTARAQSRGAHGLLSNQVDLKIIVQYPPTVQAVLDKSSFSEGQGVSMYCLASGIPDQYTYYGWIQEYKNTVIRSSNEFKTLSQHKRNLTLSGLSYQDIGTYKCLAENTITDKNGNLAQEGASNLDIKFSAIFNSSRRFYLELNRAVEIKIPFFSNPPIQNVDAISLKKQNVSQKGRRDIKINFGNTSLDIVFYGKTINVVGQDVIIQIFQSNSDLQGNYTVGVKNYNEGSVSYFVFEVKLSGPPEHPRDFRILKTSDDSVTVTWLAGNNGGHPQTFVVSYQQTGNDDTLQTINVTEIKKKINYVLSITDLLPETKYDFWIDAYNNIGHSKQKMEGVNPVVLKTAKLDQFSKCDNTAVVIAAVFGFLAGILVAGFVIALILWRRGLLNKLKGNENEKVDKKNGSQCDDIQNDRQETNVYDGINPEGAAIELDSSSRHMEYEDLDRRPESTAYQQLGDRGAAAEVDSSSRHMEYEHLDKRPESAAYQQLGAKDPETIQMSSVYINTVVK